MRVHGVLASLMVLGATACMPLSRSIVRLDDGVETAGPRISPAAYASYAHGAVLEASGNLPEAIRAYRSALEADPGSIEILTRLVSAGCLISTDSVASHFDGITERAPHYGPVWRGRAECHLSRGDAGPARDAALRAVSLRPNDFTYTDTFARALILAGETEAASRWRRAAELRRATVSTRPSPPVVETSEVDRALHDGDLPGARRAATLSRVSPAELALRALQLGLPTLALIQADLARAAAPTSADAWIAGVAAADLLGNQDQVATWLHQPPDPAEPPSPLGLEILARLLDRRAGAGPAVREHSRHEAAPETRD
jgi:hypothetical protein